MKQSLTKKISYLLLSITLTTSLLQTPVYASELSQIEDMSKVIQLVNLVENVESDGEVIGIEKNIEEESREENNTKVETKKEEKQETKKEIKKEEVKEEKQGEEKEESPKEENKKYSKEEMQEKAQNASSEVTKTDTYVEGSVLSVTLDEYEELAKIAQTEAGNQDLAGKILVVNVVLNRVDNEKFPDNIHDVIYQKSQFSPVTNGTFKKAKPSEEAYEAVNKVLNGENYANGALYFRATKSNSNWGKLKVILSYEGHKFYV